jgi:hypothetical protein
VSDASAKPLPSSDTAPISSGSLPVLRTTNGRAGDAPAAGARRPNSWLAGAIEVAGCAPSPRSATGAGP